MNITNYVRIYSELQTGQMACGLKYGEKVGYIK
jgi:hypothetical protein